MKKMNMIAYAVLCALTAAPMAAAQVVILDQIGAGPFTPAATSSSQYPLGSPGSAFTTVDNFTVPDNGDGGVRLTTVEAAIAGFSNFTSFDLIESWNVQIYSSLEASALDLSGDVYSASFDAPSKFTAGFANFAGSPVELATFEIDTVLTPGDYWITVAMENDGDLNGTVGIAGSFIGDGPAYFSGPGAGASFALGNAGGYRVIGTAVPGPAAWAVLVVLARRRRSRR